MILLLVRRRALGRAIITAVSAVFVTLLILLSAGGRGRILSVLATRARRLPIYSVATQERRLSISFDAAWGADRTPHILEVLRRYNVRTTFFLVSFWIEDYPDVARSIAAEGHEIGLHSSTHPDMTTLPRERIREELLRNRDLVREVTGFEPRLFRPPFGAYNNALIEVAEDELGLVTIQWSVDSLDWKDVTAADIVDRVLKKVHNGAIVLFHNNAEHTPAALPVILEALQADGYAIAPISELLHAPPYYIDHEGRQVKKRHETEEPR